MPGGAVLVAAMAVALSLPVLAGCSAHPATQQDALPTAPATSDPEAAGASASARPPAGPSLSFPPDVHLTFDYADTGNEAKDALLHDWEAGQRVFNAAETVRNPSFTLLARYQARKALAAAVGTLHTKRLRGQTVIGTRRFDHVEVRELAGSLARVVWCVDDSRFFARDIGTGKALVHHGPGDYYRVHGTLQHDPKNNIWVLVDAVSEVGVRC
ncbi:MAG: hypothetical protein V7637_1205 [Mycobacteriales bacterium]